VGGSQRDRRHLDCRELNPYPEVPQQVSTITYATDGTFTGKARYDAGAAPPFSGLTVETTGRWAVEENQILTSGVTTSAGSQDAFTNVLAGVVTSFVNSSDAQKQGSGDVLKLTRTELLLRPVGVEDPPTYSCSR
jgi:hypothetical protein